MSIRVLSEIFKKQLHSLGTARIAVAISEIPEGMAEKIGFSKLVDGQSVLPSIVGRVSEFNANGKTIIRKDLPKEKQYFHMNASHRDWAGNIHTSVQSRSMMVYPRELLPPPSEYLTIANGPKGLTITSRAFKFGDSPESEVDSSIVHLINLFSEIFQTFEFVGEDLVAPAAKIIKVNWKVLPAGIYPFKRIMGELTDLTHSLDENARPVIAHRLKAISDFSPDFMAVGSGGFSDYVVLGFTKKGLFILESPKLGNATYAFLNGWEEFSQLTKREILTDQHHHARLVHNLKWNASLRQLITSAK